jgi:HAD superfamily hydrolase (TIGR01509 family)
VQRLRAICFDLGGVLVRIRPTWEEAARHAGVATARSGAFETSEAFVQYQAGETAEDTYLDGLAEFLECSAEQAAAVHAAILGAEYPGTAELLAWLRDHGLTLGGYSNTNALHWLELRDPERFPTVARLPNLLASHLTGFAKPDDRAFRAWEEAVGHTNAEIGFFDDNADNVRAAQFVGWRGWRVTESDDPPRAIRQALEAVL